MTPRAAIGVVIAMLLALAQAPAASAHATLVRAEPSDGAVLAEAPKALRLTFNEPVSPLIMRIIGPDGEMISPQASAENVTVTITPPQLRPGTHVLSWRVVSADGHPVGGSLIFAVGTTTGPPPDTQAAGDPAVRAALWAAKLTIYVALVIGIGGVFFRAQVAIARPRWLARTLLSLLGMGLVAVPVSVGLQGLDALALPLSAATEGAAWAAGFATTYGRTAVSAGAALLLAAAALYRTPAATRVLALAALLGAGLALALSGHASNAAPQVLTRPAVFLHVVCVALWIGALVPLIAAVRGGDDSAIARFTRLIPYPLAALVLSGLMLAVVQLDRVDALWTTEYGEILFRKLVVVAVLLGLAVLNRYVLAPRYIAARRRRALVASIAAEIGIAVVILALVATWRFTPPPRALAAAAPILVHLHGERVMAHIELTPVRGRGATVQVQILDAELRLMTVKEVALLLANPAAGVEPVRRPAAGEGGANWRIDDVRLPIAGRWTLQAEILIDDFERVRLEDQVQLPRLP
jgi:copper transport protein